MRRRFLIPLTALALLHSAHAQSSSPETVGAPDAWTHKGNFGLSVTSGNSDTLRATLGLDSVKETELWKYTFELDAIYGEDEGVTSNERLAARFQADRDLSEKTYLGLSTNFLYDSLADIDYRSGNFAVYGYKFIESDTMNFRIEAGPGLIIEKRNGTSSTNFAYRFAQFFDWQFSKNTKLFQSLSITGAVSDPGDYLLEAEAGIESALSGPWSLRIAAKAIQYGEGTLTQGNDDFLLTAGLGYAFQQNNDDLPTISDAQDKKKFKTGEWVTTALLGGSFASGNSDSASLAIGLLSKYKTADTETSLGFNANYGQNNSETTAQTLFVDAHTQMDLKGAWFTGLRLDADHNRLSDLDYRISLAPYLGYYFIETEKAKLSLEAGPSLVIESKGEGDQTYLGAYANLKGEWILTEQTKLVSEINWLANTGDAEEFVVISTFGIDHSISDRAKLKLVLTNSYDNDPAPGRESNDLSLVTGIEFEL